MDAMQWMGTDGEAALEGTELIDVAIEGMSCAACVERVRAALQGLPGVEVANVRLGRAQVVFWPQAVSVASLLARVEELGYRIPARQASRNPVQRLLQRMGDANEQALAGYEMDCCRLKKK